MEGEGEEREWEKGDIRFGHASDCLLVGVSGENKGRPQVYLAA